MMCLACGREHIDEQDVCIVTLCELIWQREGAPPPLLPQRLAAIYGLYGNFDPVDKALYGKVALFDVDSVDARDLEDLQSSVPKTTDYIFSVMAYGQKCLQKLHQRAHVETKKKEEQAEVAAAPTAGT